MTRIEACLRGTPVGIIQRFDRLAGASLKGIG